MDSAAEEIRELVESMVVPLVDDQEAVGVDAELDGSELIIRIDAPADEVGKVIGRQGRVIKSIRTLARAAATRKDLMVDVDIND